MNGVPHEVRRHQALFSRETDIPSVAITGPVTLELDKIRRDSARSSKGKGGQSRDTLDNAEEGAEGKHGADIISRNFRNRNTDFPVSKLVSLRMLDFKDRSIISEFDIDMLQE